MKNSMLQAILGALILAFIPYKEDYSPKSTAIIIEALPPDATPMLQYTKDIPPPFTSSPSVYSGVSGPGIPVKGNGNGGWRSGSEGVIYQGPSPKPGWNTNFDGRATGSAVKQGLLPPIKPLLELHLRDTVICNGADGNYYMTGSSGDNIWDRNDGIELWRSTDLVKWDYIGLVWSIERDGSWQKQWKRLHDKPVRAVWAPEIHYIKHNYYLCFCMVPGGIALVKSQTGRPEGPYQNALADDKPLAGGIDPTLFEDEDGKVYFTYGGAGKIARMNDDLSGLSEAYHSIKLEDPGRIGHEGASLFKANGKYYLGAADTYQGRYSSMVAISDHIYGPYHSLHEAVPCGGGTNYFQAKTGQWWCCFFGNDMQAPWREKPGIVPIEFDIQGKIHPAQTKASSELQTGK